MLLFITLVVAVLIWRLTLRGVVSSKLPLPPGPQGSFFLGVKNDLVQVVLWKKYYEWSQLFQSPIIAFRVYNRQLVVLNDYASVIDLLNKRANIYSDRPKAWMYHDLCGRGDSVFNISSLNERHRQYRKLLGGGLGPQAVRSYWPVLEEGAKTLIAGFNNNPDKWEGHLRRNAVFVIMRIAYGYTVRTEHDEFIYVAEECAKISGWAMAPGRWLVDYYPILRFIPMWFPFASFRRQGEEWKRKLDHLSGVPHEWVKKQTNVGVYHESFTSRLLEQLPGVDEEVIKWCAGGLYAGAVDTTLSALHSFVLLMALHSDVQRKAQMEVDMISGDGGLQRCSNLSSAKMVYVMAVLKEVLRYAPVANLALPHRVTEEDTYAGYRIPKDATVIPNVWAIMHDSNLYPDPFKFDPGRFLNDSCSDTRNGELNPDPRVFAFGYGKRSCPGIQFAETSTLFIMASILANFDINLPGDSQPMVEFTTGHTSHIKSFEICIVPRFREE